MYDIIIQQLSILSAELDRTSPTERQYDRQRAYEAWLDHTERSILRRDDRAPRAILHIA